jgi:hypothetical protein
MVERLLGLKAKLDALLEAAFLRNEVRPPRGTCLGDAAPSAPPLQLARLPWSQLARRHPAKHRPGPPWRAGPALRAGLWQQHQGRAGGVAQQQAEQAGGDGGQLPRRPGPQLLCRASQQAAAERCRTLPPPQVAKFMDAKLRTGSKGQSELEIESQLDAAMALFRFINVGRLALHGSCLLLAVLDQQAGAAAGGSR